ncbi:fructosamine kinase family protein [Actinocorallia longicatena]|uniref:Fructosamine kinase family protein n=1 Tax=Actinocorallia longicatena TaxID=111803 RepID=A0ABP6QNR4_9ACTN
MEFLGTSHSWTLHRGVREGREVFVKRGADFSAEAHGLRRLSPLAPEVVHLGADELVLPWLEPERPGVRAAEEFGRALAGLHALGADRFGAPWPGMIADLPLDNAPAGDDWLTWYAERRCLPYARTARDAGTLSASDVTEIEAFLGRARQPAEPVSRIHGDLWSGNVHWSGGRAWLIDPAAHGGHRETDLAMLGLFGAPHLDRILAAYDEARPLAEGWRERAPLHRLHPLLVHCVLYGASYRARTMPTARSSLFSGSG